MRYRIDCPCGIAHEVAAAQAGFEVTCNCGRVLVLPSLSQLNAGESSPASVRGGESNSTSAPWKESRIHATAASNDNSSDGNLPRTMSHVPERDISSYEIISRDLTAMQLTAFAVFVPLIVLVLAVVVVVPGYAPEALYYQIPALALALIAAPGLLGYFASKRIRRMLRVLNEGPRVEGRIERADYSLPWPLSKTPKGFLEYGYSYDGRAQLGSTTVFQSRATSGWRAGDEVTVAVNPESPNQAFIVEMYLR